MTKKDQSAEFHQYVRAAIMAAVVLAGAIIGYCATTDKTAVAKSKSSHIVPRQTFATQSGKSPNQALSGSPNSGILLNGTNTIHGSINNYQGAVTTNTVHNYFAEPKKDKVFQVNGFTTTNIYVKSGARINIMATGEVNVGPLTGDVGPGGVSGLLRRLYHNQRYNILVNVPQGALLYRVGNGANWRYCGASQDFVAQSNGELQFQINDKKQDDNDLSTHFDAVVKVS